MRCFFAVMKRFFSLTSKLHTRKALLSNPHTHMRVGVFAVGVVLWIAFHVL